MSDNHYISDSIQQLVSFVVNGEEFGVEILAVQEIIRLVGTTRVPNSPPFVEGVVNLRGRIVPVINLRKRFGFGEKERDEKDRIVVLELSDKVVGFLVDEVREVIRVNSDVIEPPPELVSGVNSDFITGVAKLDESLLILLDLDRVLASEERDQLGELQAADAA